MRFDTMLAFNSLDYVINTYVDSIGFVNEKYPHRTDLIKSLNDSISNLKMIKKDFLLMEFKFESERWIKD